MRIRNIKSVNEDVIRETEFDLVVASSGFESRAINLFVKLPVSSVSKYCFSFKSFNRNIARRRNDKFFRDHGFRSVLLGGDDDKAVFEWIKKFFDRDKETSISILIDYSCMTRVWYGAMLDFFRHHQPETEICVDVFFCYSPAKFSPAPKNSPANVHVGPIKGFSNISAPNLPTALVIGLGYIPERAYGLKEYLDAVPFLFYTDSSDRNEFSYEVEKNNAKIIAEVNPRNIYTYPIKDVEQTFYELLDLCKDLRTDYRIILAPCGPKPFTLASLLVAIHIDEIDVWRISAGDKEKPIDKIAAGNLIITRVSFAN